MENDTKTALKIWKIASKLSGNTINSSGWRIKSEAGWAIVEEYQTDELASDTDDYRKIRRAEKAALEKKKQWKSQPRRPHP